MKIIKIETIPVSLPVGFFKYGMCKVRGIDTSYYSGREQKGVRKVGPSDELILDDVIVKIHSDEGYTGVGAAVPNIGFFGEPRAQRELVSETRFQRSLGIRRIFL